MFKVLNLNSLKRKSTNFTHQSVCLQFYYCKCEKKVVLERSVAAEGAVWSPVVSSDVTRFSAGWGRRRVWKWKKWLCGREFLAFHMTWFPLVSLAVSRSVFSDRTGRPENCTGDQSGVLGCVITDGWVCGFKCSKVISDPATFQEHHVFFYNCLQLKWVQWLNLATMALQLLSALYLPQLRFSTASETEADGYCSRAVCHAQMTDKSWFLRNKVELFETGGQTHQIIH